MTPLTDDELIWISAGTCPDCGHKGFRLGPRGGAAQNIECRGCRQRFNVTTFGWRVVMGQRIPKEASNGTQDAQTGH